MDRCWSASPCSKWADPRLADMKAAPRSAKSCIFSLHAVMQLFMTGSTGQPGERVSLTIWKQMRTELIWIYESTVRDVFLEQSVHSSRQSAFLIREGHLTIETEKGKITAGPGQWVFPRQGDRIQQFTAGSRVLSICYHWKWPGNQAFFDWDVALVLEAAQAPELEREALRIKWVADEVLSGSGAKLKDDSGNLLDYFQLNRAFLDWLAACALVFQRHGENLQRFVDIDSRVLRISHLLDQHVLGVPFNEREMARQIGLSTRQMNRLFIGHFKLTPRKYFERRRLEAAMDRVRFSTEPMKWIAYDLGFRTLSRFSTWFLRNAHATPSQVRKRAGYRPVPEG